MYFFCHTPRSGLGLQPARNNREARPSNHESYNYIIGELSQFLPDLLGGTFNDFSLRVHNIHRDMLPSSPGDYHMKA